MLLININKGVVRDIGVSNYSNAFEEHQQMYLQNKYTRIYFMIIKRAKSRTISGYTEKHHIIPKSIGGTNNKDNLVALTAREHFICHLLLPKMLEGDAKRKMIFAAWSFTMTNNNHCRQYSISSRTYEYLKKQRAEQLKGVPLKEETLVKRRKARAKQIITEETKLKISKSLRGRLQSTETKQKRANSLRGKKRSTETKEKMRQSARIYLEKRGPMQEEQRQKIKEARSKQIIITIQVTCPHCGKTGGNRIMPRYHFDNCKEAFNE